MRSPIFKRCLLGFATALLSTSNLCGQTALPVDVLDTPDVNYTSYSSNVGGSGFSGISDANSLGIGGGGDHFDEAFAISVNEIAYNATSAVLGTNELDLETLGLGQFDVSVNLLTSGPVLRQIVTVSNNGVAGNANVQWHNNTGNDSGQNTIATSNGDLIADTSDRWIVTADSFTSTDDNEVNAWFLHGQGGLAPSFVQTVDGSPTLGFAGEEGLNAGFDLFLQPGETASLLWFAGIEGINQDGIDLATQLDDPTSALFTSLTADLSASQRSQVVNFSASALSVPEPSSCGLLALGIMSGMAFRRRRQ